MIEVGQSFTGRVFEANASSMKVVAALLRDPNPIHFDRAAAQAAGRGACLVGQGPASAALLYQSVLDLWPGSVLLTASLRYVANVTEGDELRSEITVTGIDDDSHARRVSAAVRVLDGTGVEKVVGAVVVRLLVP